MSKPNEEQKRALALLEELVAAKARARRKTEPLKRLDEDCTRAWCFKVRSCFHRALDLRGGEDGAASQGARFHFDIGDTLYSSDMAHREPRSKWDEKETLGVQVRAGSGADWNGEERLPGRVEFDLFAIGKNGKEIEDRGSHELTQDAFVRMLVLGPEVLTDA